MHKRQRYYLFFALVVVLNIFIWSVVWLKKEPHLTVSFLDVGQGDAILIESPTGEQMLVDGGRDHAVLRELGKYMSPFDRSLDVVVETHPDADHVGGLPGVFERYTVGVFMEPGIPNDTNAVLALEEAVKNEEGLQKILARRGQRINLGGEVYIDVLFPDRDVSGLETNTGSIVMRVTYGSTSFMLTGDAPSSIEDYLVGIDGTTLKTDVLKAGHHGSRNSTDELWLLTLQPRVVVISAGEGNSYGHPHTETLERIHSVGARVLSTLGQGAVIFQSDGTTIIQK